MADLALEDMAGRLVSHDVEHDGAVGRGGGEVVGMQGVAVHGAVGEGRQIDVGLDVGRQRQSRGLPRRHLAHLGGAHASEHDAARLLDGIMFASGFFPRAIPRPFPRFDAPSIVVHPT